MAEIDAADYENQHRSMKALATWGLVFGFCVTVIGARCLFAPEALDKDFVQVFGTIFGIMGLALLVMSVRVWRKLQASTHPGPTADV
jgi:uncharacterized membrane protein HdeD (DUF308 family)